MQKIVIVKPGCRELGNELLNRMSIMAWGLEAGAQVSNHSGFGYTGLRKWGHVLYARVTSLLHSRQVVHAWRAPVYLPPTKPLGSNLKKYNSIYLYGWLYRNPTGLKKYRLKLIEAVQPSLLVQKEIAQILEPQKSRTLIGIHLRQQSFKGFAEGEFLVSPRRVRTILDEYIAKNNLDATKAALVVVSDFTVPPSVFGDFPTYMSYRNTDKNLFLLSECTVIIGTNTTFSNMSAWFGNVPHIVTTNEPIDWPYYAGQSVYFENKYATFAFT